MLIVSAEAWLHPASKGWWSLKMKLKLLEALTSLQRYILCRSPRSWSTRRFDVFKKSFIVRSSERLIVFPRWLRSSRSRTAAAVIAAASAQRRSHLHGYVNNICGIQANSITSPKSQYRSASPPFQNAFIWIRKRRDKVRGFLTSSVQKKSRRLRFQWSHATVISSLFSEEVFNLTFLSIPICLPALLPSLCPVIAPTFVSAITFISPLHVIGTKWDVSV